jgi:hypothetical protein
MSQVNVNPPAGGPVEPAPVGEPPGSAGAGMILGIVVAILVIAALIYFLLIAPGTQPANTTDGGGQPAPTGWMLTQRA